MLRFSTAPMYLWTRSSFYRKFHHVKTLNVLVIGLLSCYPFWRVVDFSVRMLELGKWTRLQAAVVGSSSTFSSCFVVSLGTLIFFN